MTDWKRLFGAPQLSFDITVFPAGTSWGCVRKLYVYITCEQLNRVRNFLQWRDEFLAGRCFQAVPRGSICQLQHGGTRITLFTG
jgi:hypothetical protein